MTRQMDAIPVTFATNTSSSPAFSLGPYTGAIILIGATWNTCQIGFTLSNAEAGTFVPYVANSLSTYGVMSAPSMAIPVPIPVATAARWVRLLSHSNGELITQAAPTVTILRKE